MPSGLPERGLSTAILMPAKSKGHHLGGLLGEGMDGDHDFRKLLFLPGRHQGDKLLTGVGGRGGAALSLPHRKPPQVLTGGGGGVQRILLVSEKSGRQEGDPRPGRSWVCGLGLGLWWAQAGLCEVRQKGPTGPSLPPAALHVVGPRLLRAAPSCPIVHICGDKQPPVPTGHLCPSEPQVCPPV